MLTKKEPSFLFVCDFFWRGGEGGGRRAGRGGGGVPSKKENRPTWEHEGSALVGV